MRNYYLLLLILFTTILRSQLPSTSPTGTSTEVGETVGNLSVSSSGGANYEVQIAMPPGINGVTPDIKLTYSSQSGNGLAGYGWGISGLSSITRVAATNYHDNMIDPVDFDSNDRFAFNGQRLLPKSGYYYTQDGAVFETESFSNIKIVRHGISTYGANYGPDYFTVEYPDGSKAYYGFTPDSKSKMEWAISYWENPQGIRINYFYSSSNGQLRVTTIRYGARLDDTGMNAISFTYATRQRPETTYAGGFPFNTSYILKEITTSVNSTGFRKYVLAHDVTSLGYERLTSITELSGDGTKSLNPTVFSYNNTNELISFNDTPTPLDMGIVNFENHVAVPGYFDADDKIDFILYPTDPAQKNRYLLKGSGSNDWNQNNILGFDAITPVSFLIGTPAMQDFKLYYTQGWAIIRKESSSLDITIHSLTFPGSSDPTVTLQYNRDVPYYQIGGGGAEVYRRYYSGDYNMDGVTDLLVVNEPTGNVYFVNFDKRINNVNATVSYVGTVGQIVAGDQLMVADQNGDGRPDLWKFGSGSIQVLSVDGTFLYNTGDGDINTTRPMLIGDYNGDGKSDFITPLGYGNNFAKYISTGSGVTSTGFIKTYHTYDIPFLQNSIQGVRHIIANDFNNDGKTDLAAAFAWRNHNSPSNAYYQQGQISVRVFHNTNNGFTDAGMYATTGYRSDIFAKAIPICLTSDKANKNLQISFIVNSSIFHFQSEKNSNTETLLKSITIGNGVTETITYKPMNQNSIEDNAQVYVPERLAVNFPNSDIFDAYGYKVVSKIEKHSNFSYQKQLYTYLGAVSNYSGLGFLGFKVVKQTNWHNDPSKIISKITKFDINLNGVPKEEYLVAGNPVILNSAYTPSTYITKSVSTYESTLFPNKVLKIKRTGLSEYNGLDGTSKVSSFIYDEYNNVTQTSHTQYNGTTVEQTGTSTIAYYNDPSGSVYYVGRLKDKATSVSHDGDTMTSRELYTYNDAHLLSKYQKKGHLTGYLVEENIYDSYGNITKKTISYPALVRELNYEYSPDGRFITKRINVEGQATQYVYDTSKCLLLTETNPFGHSKHFEYDSWHREKIITDYFGKKKNITYEKMPFFTNMVLITTSCEDGSVVTETKDEMGRSVYSSYLNLNGSHVYVHTTYDINGRITGVSEPYTVEPSQYTTYEYDIYDRLIKKVDPTGKITTYTYNGLITTTVDGARTSTITKNSLEYTTSSTDEGGTITYQYFANGNMKQSNFDGFITTFEQDGWGRRTKIVDPVVGTYSYEFNALGQIKKEITPKGETTYFYNSVGKLTDKSEISGSYSRWITYMYHFDTKLPFGHDMSDSNGDSYGIFYWYDNYQRVQEIEEIAFYATYKKTYVYDDFGRIKTETLFADNSGMVGAGDKSVSKTLKYTYKNGYKWQMFDNLTNQLLWENTLVNTRGQSLTAKYGNGVTRNNTYDDFGYPTQSSYDKSGSTPVNLFTLTTDFDEQTGNLLTRSSSLFNWNESFQYDALYRLKEFTNVRGEQETITFDSKGRITNTSYGQNSFDQTKVYEHTSTQLSAAGTAHYKNRVGIFRRTMEDKKGWNINPLSTFYTTVQAKTGQYSLSLSSPSAQFVDSDTGVDINNTTSTQYTVSGWVYFGSGTANASLYLKTQTTAQISANTFTLSTPAQQSYVAGAWQHMTFNVTVDPSVKRLSIRLYKAGSAVVYFDDIHIIKTSDATEERKLNAIYNLNNDPTEITETGVDKLTFTYNTSDSRSALFYGSLDSDPLMRPLRKFYSLDGTFEIKHNIVTNKVEFVVYVGGDCYNAPIALTKNDNAEEYLYLHRDYLRSIVAITNSAGNIVEKRLFDAWGNIVFVKNGSGVALAGLMLLDRGYTGHEHLQTVGLIHMNGRIYDPVSRRFLQVDNHIQDYYNTQNYNRYAYVLNNPLMFVDYSGESFEDWLSEIDWGQVAVVVVAVAVGTVVTVATAGAGAPLMMAAIYGGAAGGFVGGSLGSALNGGSALDILVSGLIGAGTGAIMGAGGAYAASLAPAGILYGGLYGAFSSVSLSGIMNVMFGQNFFANVGTNAALGFVGGGYQGAVSARATGGNIWTGARPKPSTVPFDINAEIAAAQQEYLDAQLMATQPNPNKTIGLNSPSNSLEQSLGYSRRAAKEWLKNVGNIDQSRLVQDLENMGFKNVGGGNGMQHYERGMFKIRLDPPHGKTHYDHMHINIGNSKKSFDVNLLPVKAKKDGAHIPIKPNKDWIWQQRL